MKQKLMLTAFVIFLTGCIFQICLQKWMRPYTSMDGYFHRWTSEHFMQALPIEDLRDTPVLSLLSNHIIPPVFDIIRAVLANIWAVSDPRILTSRVDHSLYILGAVLCGLIGTLIFCWLSDMTKTWFATVAALIFIAHPAYAFYATFLDSTLLSGTLILWMYYLLWRFRKNLNTSVTLFAIAVLINFFTRAIFQLPSFIILAASLCLLKVPAKKVTAFLAITMTFAGLYAVKQYIQFGVSTTSSFSGFNLVKSIGIYENEFYGYWSGKAVLKHTELPNYPLPEVMTRKWKWTKTPNFNHICYLRKNKQFICKFKRQLKKTPLSRLAASYMDNVRLYFKPSIDHEKDKNILVNHLWWRNLYNRIFSFPILPALLLFAGIVWILKAEEKAYPAGTALILPGLYIFLISVLCEKGENMRYKLFLEPVFFVFIASQLYAIAKQMWNLLIDMIYNHNHS